MKCYILIILLFVTSLQAEKALIKPQQAFIGIATAPMPEMLASQLKISSKRGILIHRVLPNSPGAKAGLQRFDIILKVNGENLLSSIPLANVVELFKAGDEVNLQIIRQGESKKIKLVLGVAPKRLLVQQTPSHLQKKIAKMFNDQKCEMEFKNLEEVEEMVKKMRQQALIEFKAQQADDQYISQSTSYSTITQKDDQHQLTLNFSDEATTATIKDLKGKIIFEGPVDTEEDFNKVPKKLRKKISRLQNRFKLHYKKKLSKGNKL